jgi:4-amino-4-deoxy-L-arabinose transferase-like glycosyltransferase
MALVFFYTLTVWSGWEWTRPEPSHRMQWWWVLFTGFALTFLAKGPEGYLPLVALVVCRRVRKADFELRPVPTLAGFFFSLGLIGLWGIPALLQTHGKYLDVGIGEHVIHRSVGVNDSHGLRGYGGFLLSLPLYFLTFFASFFPWSIRMPGAIRRWWPKRGGDAIGWYLMVQALVVFAVFSLVRTKLPHYTMPAFPCIALWLARQLAPGDREPVLLGKQMAGMAVFMAIVMFGFFSFAKYDFLTENLWRATRAYVRPETRVGCFGFNESSLVWRYRTISTNRVTLGQEKDAADFLTNPPPFILVLPTRDLANLPDTNDLRIQVGGLDIVRFKHWDLTAIVRP